MGNLPDDPSKRDNDVRRYTKTWNWFLLYAFILMVFQISIVLITFELEILSMASLFAILGISSFWSVLMIAFWYSQGLDTGAVRRAIAITATILYLVLVAVIAFTEMGPSEEQQTWILTDFTAIYAVIIGFYFYTRKNG